MKINIPRLRMFAGPNGSGKSTLNAILAPHLLGIYINPDEIEKQIKTQGYFDFSSYDIDTNKQELQDFFTQSTLLDKAKLKASALSLPFINSQLDFPPLSVNSYFAAVLADFLRRKYLKQNITFTFETVMSSPDKVALLKLAQEEGYRTYLYYIATDDPKINISRVQNRVRMGGHPVPENKIISRYHNSLKLLQNAIKHSNRAYIFDNSGFQQTWIAEITNGQEIELKLNNVPIWFQQIFTENSIGLEL